jgi:hypothetical protein
VPIRRFSFLTVRQHRFEKLIFNKFFALALSWVVIVPIRRLKVLVCNREYFQVLLSSDRLVNKLARSNNVRVWESLRGNLLHHLCIEQLLAYEEVYVVAEPDAYRKTLQQTITYLDARQRAACQRDRPVCALNLDTLRFERAKASMLLTHLSQLGCARKANFGQRQLAALFRDFNNRCDLWTKTFLMKDR